jgi:hypothetical protein
VVPLGDRMGSDGGDLRLLHYPDGSWRFGHVCDRSARDAGTLMCAPLLGEAHVVQDQADGVWVTPSISCSDCGTHGWVRSGAWVPA